jgi:hypothetical protein
MQKTRKNTSLKDRWLVVRTKNFEIYVSKDETLLCDKQNDIILRCENKNPGAEIRNIVNLLDAAFEHALQKRKEKEQLVEDLPDIDR